MKANLRDCKDVKLAGYEDIICSYHNLDSLIEDGELEELRAIEILPLFSAKDFKKIIAHWTKKIAHKGKIIIGILDVMEIAKGIMKYDLTVEQARLYLYGHDNEKLSVFSIREISNELENLGLKIMRKRVEDYKAIVEAQRL